MRVIDILLERSKKEPGVDPRVAAAQQHIIQQIPNILDIDELHQIYSYIRKIDIGSGIDNILSKDEDLKQVHTIISRAIIDAKAPFDDKMAFAQELATKGIINIKQLLTPGVWQNLDDVVQTKYPTVYQQVSSDLLNISGKFKSGKTTTNKGKGEFFLAIASPKIMLSKDAGDLIINGRLVEVKGNGARIIGVRGYGTTNQAISQVRKSAAQFISTLTNKLANTTKKSEPLKAIDPTKPDTKPTAPQWTGRPAPAAAPQPETDTAEEENPTAVAEARGAKIAPGTTASQIIASKDAVSVGSTNPFWSGFGPALIQQGAKPKDVAAFVKASITSIFQSLYLEASDSDVAAVVNPSITDQGVINFDAFIPNLKRFAYAYYQKHDKFQGILFLNGTTGNFIYTQTPDEFESNLTIQKLGFNTGSQNGMQVKVP